MENKLQNYFFKSLFIIVLFIFAFVLFGREGKKIDLKEVHFNTTESSEIYFKNIRSYFYDKEYRDDAQFVLYRIGSRVKDSTQHLLNFVLVSNWLQDQCYIIAEPFDTQIQILVLQDNEIDTLTLSNFDSEAQYTFAAKFFEKLTQKNELYLLENNVKNEFSEQEKLSLKTTLTDYFKMVGKIR